MIDLTNIREQQAIRHCLQCKEVINTDNVFTEAGRKEVEISGICEVCFDYSLDTTVEEYLDDLSEETGDGDYEILKLVRDIHGVFLAGGFWRSVQDPSNEIVEDYDLFFTGVQAKEEIEKQLISMGFAQLFKCPQGELTTYKQGDHKVQLVTKFWYKSQEDLIGSFDITACCASWDGEKFICNRRFKSDVMNKRIYLNKITFPVATMNRIAKYSRKGYKLMGKTNMEFLEFINGIDFADFDMALYVD